MKFSWENEAAPWSSAAGPISILVASDASAIIPYTRSVIYLDDNECAVLREDEFESFRLDETPIIKEVEQITL